VRRELARGGAKPSSEAEVSWRGTYPSSETEGCPRGVEATVCWAAETFWAMGLSLPWAVTVRGVIYSCEFDHLLSLKKGDFSCY
jgi:hypothetical protein